MNSTLIITLITNLNMSSSGATISVIIPTYNRPYLIKRSIQSVLAQTYTDFELIVVDDGSGKDVRKSINEFSDDRIHYIRHEDNMNANAARNTGIKNSNGEYIALLDDDDVWLPWKLRFQLRMIENTPDNVGILMSSFFIIDRFDNELSIFIDREQESDNFAGVPSRWIIKKDAIQDVGLFDIEMPTMQDLEFSARLLDTYEAIYDDFPVTVYYQRTERKNIEGREKLLSKHSDKMSEKYKYNQLFALSTSYLEDSNFDMARKRSREAMQLEPLEPKLYVLFMIACLEKDGLYETSKKILENLRIL